MMRFATSNFAPTAFTNKAAVALVALVLLGLISVLLAPEAFSDQSRAVVVVLTVVTTLVGWKIPRTAGVLLIMLYLVTSFEPSYRNLATVLGGVVTIGLLSYSERIRLAVLFGLVMGYIATTEIFKGEFLPSSPEALILFSVLFFGVIVGAWLIRKARKQAENTEASKRLQREMLIKMLHDSVATTLSSAILRAEIVKLSTEVPEQEKEELSLIADENRKAIEEVRNLIRIINEDDLSRIEKNLLLSEHIQNFKHLVTSHGFRVNLHIDPNVPQELYALMSVPLPVMNELASNVIKYGDPASRVLINVFSERGGIMIVIKNGIARKESPKFLSSGVGLKQISAEVVGKGGEFSSAAEENVWVSKWFIGQK